MKTIEAIEVIKMKKKFCALLVLALALCWCLSAFAAARMPENRGALTDDANVLGTATAKDVTTYAERVEEETGVKLHVALVNFLDGVEVKTYARQLFQRWELGGDDLLLLGAAGEDSFAAVMGGNVEKKLGASNAENLLYTSSSFAGLFQSQQYDAAFASFFTALNGLLERQYDADISLKGLFQTEETAAAEKPSTGSELWEQVIGSITENTADYQQYHETHEQDEDGLSARGWLVVAILVMIVFSQSDPVRKSRRKRQKKGKRMGLVGWILTLLGAKTVLKKLRRRR